MVYAEDPLAQAERHVREGEERVARQTALVARMTARRLDPTEAELILGRLRTSLRLQRDHLIRLARDRRPPAA
jgi:hypothetical protein